MVNMPIYQIEIPRKDLTSIMFPQLPDEDGKLKYYQDTFIVLGKNCPTKPEWIKILKHYHKEHNDDLVKNGWKPDNSFLECIESLQNCKTYPKKRMTKILSDYIGRSYTCNEDSDLDSENRNYIVIRELQYFDMENFSKLKSKKK